MVRLVTKKKDTQPVASVTYQHGHNFIIVKNRLIVYTVEGVVQDVQKLDIIIRAEDPFWVYDGWTGVYKRRVIDPDMAEFCEYGLLKSGENKDWAAESYGNPSVIGVG